MSAAAIEFEHDAVIQQLGLHIESTALHDYCRFSESGLWPLQRQYYARQGVNAARREQLALQDAKTPLLAENYCDVILAYWEDAWASGQLDAQKPVYILELGAGGGAFTHALLKCLAGKIAHSPLQELQWAVLAADMVQGNLDHLRHHPRLRDWVRDGHLDTVCFDIETAGPGLVSTGGIKLDELDNPLVMISNGVFGALTQDLLQIHYGKILEAQVAIGRQAEHALDAGASDEFSRKLYRLDNPFAGIELNYSWKLQSNLQWLPVQCREILADYLARLDSCSLLIPTSAISCMEYLLSISAGRCLLLGFDRGHYREQDLRRQSAPQLRVHGDFSLPVNYHLLHRMVQRRGGLAWASPQRGNNDLLVSAILFADDKSGFGNTQMQINARLLNFGIDDYLHLRTAMATLAPSLPAEALLSVVKLGRCDPTLVSALHPALGNLFGEISIHERRQWQLAMAQTWHNHFPNGADSRELFQLGQLTLELNDFVTALEIFSHLAERHPAEASIAHNLAVVLLLTGRTTKAIRLLEHSQTTADPAADVAVPELLSAARGLEQHFQALPWYTPACAANDDLLLRPLCWLDATVLHYQYRDPAIAVLTRLPAFESVDEVEQWIAEETAEPGKAVFAIIHKELGFAGVVSFRFVSELAYFYFWIGTDFQNAGIGQQAAMLAGRQAAALGIRTFYTSVYCDNRRSIHALEKTGFEKLPLAACEPDEDLIFYRRLLNQAATINCTAAMPPEVEVHRELAELLQAIASPIQLQPIDNF